MKKLNARLLTPASGRYRSGRRFRLGRYESGQLPILTARQIEVLSLYADGLTTQAIATRLKISVWTVKEHNRQIRWALDARTIAHAVALAYRRGIMEIPAV